MTEPMQPGLRNRLTNQILTRFKLVVVLAFVALLLVYLLLSFLITNKTIPAGSSIEEASSKSQMHTERMVKLLERVLQVLASFVLPMPAPVLGKLESSSNGSKA